MTKTSNRCQDILEQDRWCGKQNVDPHPPALSKALCMEPIILFPVPVDKAEKQPGRQWANTTSVTQTAHTQGSPWHRPKENCRFGRSGDKWGGWVLSHLWLLRATLGGFWKKRYEQVHCLGEGFYLLVLDFGAAASLLPPCSGGRSSLSAPPPIFITWLGSLHWLQICWWWILWWPTLRFSGSSGT